MTETSPMMEILENPKFCCESQFIITFIPNKVPDVLKVKAGTIQLCQQNGKKAL